MTDTEDAHLAFQGGHALMQRRGAVQMRRKLGLRRHAARADELLVLGAR